MDIPHIINILKKNYQPELFLTLTKTSTEYIEACTLNKDYSESKLNLENSLKDIDELKDLDADEFATNLVKYLYVNRQKIK